eukprot:CAMPEP_0194230280 /NCGR_PEP_ID=MMETSP0156-20130528/44328_1 /TAXON_ID=33649 /ORGANISM="Thalassionema nitzschioides, Strain L26-B" /LENGTH=546 /DNA_ID=CAMNT_0038962859 /DNA_START=69 /DNA_END=1709 /DNA_ORIENTATION=-
MTKASDNAPLLPSQQQPQQEEKERSVLFLRFVAFSVAFSLAEAAVVACLSVATSVLDTYGSLSVGVLYATFAIGTLFAGSLVRASGHNALRPLLVGSIAGMGLFNLACWGIAIQAGGTFDDGRIPVSSTQGLILLGVAIISGLADGLIWPAVGAYITMSAQKLSVERSQQEEEAAAATVNYGSSENTADSSKMKKASYSIIDSYLPRDFHVLAGTLTAWFNVIFLSSLVLIHVYTYYAFRVQTYDGMLQAYTQIFVMTLVGIIIMFVAMAPASAEVEYEEPCNCINCPGTCGAATNNRSNSNADKPDAISDTTNPILLAIGLTATEPALYHLVPSHIAYGLIDGLVFGFVARHLVPNIASVGILATVKSGTAILGTPLITRLGNGPSTMGRINLVWYGNVLYLWCVLLVGLNLYWKNSPTVVLSNWFLWANLIIIYMLDGLGFSTWQNNTSGALLSEIAPTLVPKGGGINPAEVTAAVFTGCKASSGLATATAFFVAPFLPGYAVVGLGVTVALGALYVLRLAENKHIFICTACQGWSFGHFRKRE